MSKYFTVASIRFEATRHLKALDSMDQELVWSAPE